MSIEPPPVLPGPPEGSGETASPPMSANKAKGPLGAIAAFFAAAWKFILPALKFLKGAKFLLTGFTMVASV